MRLLTVEFLGNYRECCVESLSWKSIKAVGAIWNCDTCGEKYRANLPENTEDFVIRQNSIPNPAIKVQSISFDKKMWFDSQATKWMESNLKEFDNSLLSDIDLTWSRSENLGKHVYRVRPHAWFENGTFIARFLGQSVYATYGKVKDEYLGKAATLDVLNV